MFIRLETRIMTWNKKNQYVLKNKHNKHDIYQQLPVIKKSTCAERKT